jgi:hypothetical protein
LIISISSVPDFITYVAGVASLLVPHSQVRSVFVGGVCFLQLQSACAQAAVTAGTAPWIAAQVFPVGILLGGDAPQCPCSRCCLDRAVSRQDRSCGVPLAVGCAQRAGDSRRRLGSALGARPPRRRRWRCRGRKRASAPHGHPQQTRDRRSGRSRQRGASDPLIREVLAATEHNKVTATV